MRDKRIIAAVGLALLMLSSLESSQLWAQPAAVRGVFGTGGGTVQDATHRLSGTFGQPMAGKTGGPANESWGGFWYTIEQAVEGTESPTLPTVYSLDQNYPNPFQTETTISYGLPEPCMVEITIHDVQGRLVVRPEQEHQAAGCYQLTVHAQELSPGIYFYRLTAEGFVATRKMVLVK